VHLLEVTGSLGVGGAEKMILQSVQHLRSQLTELTFLVFDEQPGALEDEATKLPAEVVRLPGSGRRSVPTVSEMSDLMRQRRVDVVHSHVNFASGTVMLAAARAGVGTRLAHAHITQDRNQALARRIYRHLSRGLINRYATHLVACGEEAGVHLFGGPQWRSRGVVVPNGTSLDRFAVKSDESCRVRQDLGIPWRATLLVSVARMVDFKNQGFLLDLIALDKSRAGDLHLLFVGDGPLRCSLERRALELGIAERVTFAGLRDDVPRIMGSADVLGMPSHYEGLPVALVEAQAAGLPSVVSTNVTGEADLGLGLVTFVSLSDPEGWITALKQETDIPERSAIRKRFVERGYESSASAQKLGSLIGLQ
jgi:glycosyltransferase EpsF